MSEEKEYELVYFFHDIIVLKEKKESKEGMIVDSSLTFEEAHKKAVEELRSKEAE